MYYVLFLLILLFIKKKSPHSKCIEDERGTGTHSSCLLGRRSRERVRAGDRAGGHYRQLLTCHGSAATADSCQVQSLINEVLRLALDMKHVYFE